MDHDGSVESILFDDRIVSLFPIRYPAIWRAYKRSMKKFWIADCLKLSGDTDDWAALTEDERLNILFCLLFLGETNRLHHAVLNNVACEIAAPEARYFFDFQCIMENIHAEAISKLLSSFVTGDVDRSWPFIYETGLKALATKAIWSSKWSRNPDVPFGDLLIALAAIKGVFLSSVSCMLSWISEQGLLEGLEYAHTLIKSDNDSHVEFVALLVHHLQTKPSEERAMDIITEAVDLERAFATDMMSVCSLDMQLDTIHQYTEFTADTILSSMGYRRFYDSPQPSGTFLIHYFHCLPGEERAKRIAFEMRTAYSIDDEEYASGVFKPLIYDIFTEERIF